MPQPLLPMFPADVTEINDLVSFAKREGTAYYFNGLMPVFSHAESDRASFRMAQGPKVESWSASLSQQWMEQAPELAGRLYVDGHVRVYHGHQACDAMKNDFQQARQWASDKIAP